MAYNPLLKRFGLKVAAVEGNLSEAHAPKVPPATPQANSDIISSGKIPTLVPAKKPEPTKEKAPDQSGTMR